MALYSKGHLQEERQDDHGAAQGDLLKRLLRDADAEVQVLEQVRIQQGGLAAPLAANEPEGERDQGHCADAYEQADIGAALLPDEDAEDDAAHANH
jgi:hypothetical protein